MNYFFFRFPKISSATKKEPKQKYFSEPQNS